MTTRKKVKESKGEIDQDNHHATQSNQAPLIRHLERIVIVGGAILAALGMIAGIKLWSALIAGPTVEKLLVAIATIVLWVWTIHLMRRRIALLTHNALDKQLNYEQNDKKQQ